MKISLLLSILTAVVKRVVTPEVLAVIKKSIFDFIAAANDGWSEGELRDFVIREAREVAAATPTELDDMLVEITVYLYTKKYIATKAIPAPAAA